MTTTTASPTLHRYIPRGRIAVRRIILDSGTTMWWEISCIRRPEQLGATYQGTIRLHNGQWTVEVAKVGGHVESLPTTFADYLDAEDALLRIRTGVMSDVPWKGPRPRRCEEDNSCGHVWVGEPGSRCPKHTYCRRCGWPLTTDGVCLRPDLHWDKESLA